MTVAFDLRQRRDHDLAEVSLILCVECYNSGFMGADDGLACPDHSIVRFG